MPAHYVVKVQSPTPAWVKLASVLASMAIDLLCIFALLIAMASASGEPYKQAQAFFLYVIAISVNKVTIKNES